MGIQIIVGNSANTFQPKI